MMDTGTKRDESPPIGAVLAALDDAGCRAILREASDPMTAMELTDACDIPKSTLYRKLDRLSRASLVREHVAIAEGGGRTTRYVRAVTDVTVSVGDDGVSVAIDRPTQSAEDRLADMWSEVREEL